MNPQSINIDDMSNHSRELNQVDILNNLKNRFAQDSIFTNIGKSLIIINPYKLLQEVFSEEKMDFFISVLISKVRNLKRKLFSVSLNTKSWNLICLIILWTVFMD
jgi:hypothetical protein